VAGLSRGALLTRGGQFALAGSALGLLPARALAATPSDNDLAYARLLVVAELLAIDFYQHALRAHGASAGELHRALSDERRHHEAAAAILTSGGQVPPGPGDVDFVYPKRAFASQKSVAELGARLESIFLGAYLGATAGFVDDSLKVSAARAAASEAQHLSAFTGRVGPAFPRPLAIDQASNALAKFTA
jgi:Ferritin-like domain